MKRTISFLLLIAVISLMTGCNSENNQVAAEESVSINLIPIYSHAKTKAETGILNLSNPFRPFYLFSGWSATYVLEENGPAFVAAIGKESILRYNIYKPHDRWFIFKVNNDGKYGGPNWQEMQIFSGDNLLGKYEVRKEEQEIQVYIPAEYQKVGENFLNLKFAILWDNPIWMAKREDHSEFPFPFICTYFNDLKFKTGSKEGPEYQETRDETDAFKLILDDKFLSQTPPSTISYAFDIHEGSSLNLEGTAQSSTGDDETVSFEVKARTDEEKGWKSLWQKDVVFENGSVSESYDGIVDLSAYAGKNLEFSISAMSSAISPSTTVIWKTLSLDVNTPPVVKKEEVVATSIKGKAKNVIVIILDAARWDRYGMNGSDLQATLNIDEFSKEALVFKNPVASAPYTITSVSTIFSGLQPEAHGVRRISQEFPAELESMPKVFRKNGYYGLCLSGSKFITPKFGLATDFDQVVPMRTDEYKQAQVTTMNPEGIKKGIADAAKSGKPVFMYAHFLPPHWPYRPPAPYDSFYTTGEEVKMRKAWMVKAALDYNLIPPDNKDIYTYERRYYNNLRYGDSVVQMVFDELKANGLYEDSIIIVASDHGEAFGEHKQFGHNTTVYEHMIKVPMTIKVPGTKPAVIKQQVGLIDLFPTLVDLMELETEFVGFHGRSLSTLLATGKETPQDNYYFARTNSPGYYFMMRGERFKYIHAEFEEFLFDLEKDPGEQVNIIDQHPVLAATLRQKGLMMIAVNEKAGNNIGKEAELTDEDEEELKNLGYLQ